MKTRLLLLASLITICICACKKGGLDDQRSIDLTGKWRWVKSVGGIGGLTLTPLSTGYVFRNEFYADSSYKRFRNDSLVEEKKFSVTKNFKYTDSETIDLLKVGDFSDSFVIRNDTLYMTDVYISDGYSSIYVRTN